MAKFVDLLLLIIIAVNFSLLIHADESSQHGFPSFNHSHDQFSNFTKSYFPLRRAMNCSLEFGEEGTEQCQGLHVKISHFSPNLLEEVLNEDDSTLTRRIYIDIHQHPNNPSTSNSAIGAALDAFLAPRPW